MASRYTACDIQHMTAGPAMLAIARICAKAFRAIQLDGWSDEPLPRGVGDLRQAHHRDIHAFGGNVGGGFFGGRARMLVRTQRRIVLIG